jgi:transposase
VLKEKPERRKKTNALRPYNKTNVSNFVNLLNYKCDWYEKELVKVNVFYSSPKTCNCCGWINQNLKISDRE